MKAFLELELINMKVNGEVTFIKEREESFSFRIGLKQWVNVNEKYYNQVHKQDQVSCDVNEKNNLVGSIHIIEEEMIVKEEVIEEKVISPQLKPINKNYYITISGKEYITHAGLLHIAYEQGIQSIETDLVEKGETIIFKAIVTMKNGSYFSAYGDANDKNVNKMIMPHKIRMAETRAVSRALRFATNIGTTAAEELGGDQNQ